MKSKRFPALGVLAAAAVAVALLLSWLLFFKKPPAPPPVTTTTLPPEPVEVTAQTAMKLLAPEQYPRFTDDADPDGLVRSIGFSREYYSKLDKGRLFRFGPNQHTARQLMGTIDKLEAFARANPKEEDWDRFIRENFLVYRSVGSVESGDMLFTGYYEPVLLGSRTKTKKYRHPFYQVPDDLLEADLGEFSESLAGKKIYGQVRDNHFVPYYTRRQIDTHQALAGRGLEIAWAADPIDLFFFHIQGSGRLQMDDGQTQHVVYAGKNGRAYKSIGRLLIDEGKIPKEEMSMQRLRRYLEENPEDARRVFNYNESYVFFREAERGPIGCIQVPLTPGRSVATDRRLFPGGAPCFIKSQKPVLDETGAIAGWVDFSRFALNQDTGGAIRGAGRLDVFWGHDDYAVAAAGHAQHPGELYFIVAKPH